METVLDGVRKNDIKITSQLINACLNAVDYLRLLRDEVSSSQTCNANIDEIASLLRGLIGDGKEEPQKKLRILQRHWQIMVRFKYKE